MLCTGCSIAPQHTGLTQLHGHPRAGGHTDGAFTGVRLPVAKTACGLCRLHLSGRGMAHPSVAPAHWPADRRGPAAGSSATSRAGATGDRASARRRPLALPATVFGGPATGVLSGERRTWETPPRVPASPDGSSSLPAADGGIGRDGFWGCGALEEEVKGGGASPACGGSIGVQRRGGEASVCGNLGGDRRRHLGHGGSRRA